VSDKSAPSGSGPLLDPRNTKILFFVLSFVMVAGLFFCAEVYVSFQDGLEKSGHVLGRDFVNYWMGGQAVANGWLDELFNVDAYVARLRDMFGASYPGHNWSYPPHYLFLVAPLALFSYLTAFFVWIVCGLTAYGFSLRSLKLPLSWYIIALAAAPVALAVVFFGQNGLITGALVLAGLGLRDRRPWLAGIFIGLLTIKPQLGLLIPFLLIIQQNWKTLASAAVTTVILIVASAIVFGWQSWSTYFTVIAPYQTDIMTDGKGIFIAMMPTAFMAARSVEASVATSAMVHVIFAVLGLTMALVTMWVTRHDRDRSGASAVTILATFVVVPYIFNYDMPAVVGAVLIWMSAHLRRPSLPRAAVASFALSLPIVGPPLALIGLSVAPVVMLALLAIVTSDVCGEHWARFRRGGLAVAVSRAPR